MILVTVCTLGDTGLQGGMLWNGGNMIQTDCTRTAAAVDGNNNNDVDDNNNDGDDNGGDDDVDDNK